LQDLAESAVDVEFLLEDGNEQVNADGNPDLSLDRVLGCSIEGLNAKILLDLFEKEFHAPTALVKLRNGQGQKGKVVGEEDKAFLGIRIQVTDAPKRLRIDFGSFGTFENDRLVAA
jgi:hypothetical protein